MLYLASANGLRRSPVWDALIRLLEEAPLPLRALITGLIPAALTTLGCTPVLLGAKLSEEARDAGMGFAAGVMLVASFTSLLLPAVELGGAWMALAGFLLGAALIKLLDMALPHMHLAKGYEGPRRTGRLGREWLIALAMIVHNVPEGMAVGAAASRDVMDGLLLGLAIGLQDVPEGLAVALPLAAGGGRLVAFSVGALSGLSEALAALIPPLIVEHVSLALPLMLALAAGAMVYVVVHEVVPEIYGHEHDEPSTLGFFAGFTAMLLLDTLLG